VREKDKKKIIKITLIVSNYTYQQGPDISQWSRYTSFTNNTLGMVRFHIRYQATII